MATDAQWDALCAAIGAADWASDPALATQDDRRAAHDEIDERLAWWCGQRSADDIVEILWAAGFPVAKVMQPHGQTELPQLAHRGFFEEVAHPVNPPTPHSSLPFRLSTGPQQFHRRPAPLLGEHTEELLAELGLTADDIARLAADKVIGHTV